MQLTSHFCMSIYSLWILILGEIKKQTINKQTKQNKKQDVCGYKSLSKAWKMDH